MLKKQIISVLLLFLVAFTFRIGFTLWQGIGSAPLSGSDAAEYDQYAWNLAQGYGYRGRSPDVSDQEHLTAYRPPGTSLLWAGMYSIFGHRYDIIRILNCLLGALSSVLLLHLGRLSVGNRIGWGAAIVWAGFPTSLYFSSELSSEPLMLVLLLGFLVASLSFGYVPTLYRALTAGTLLGMTFLVHPSKVILLPLVILWVIWQFRRESIKLLRGLIIPVIATMLLIPWTIRNYIVFNEFIPFSTMGGSVLLQGNNRIVATDPTLRGYVIWDTKIPEYTALLQKPNNEVERDKVARSLALQWVGENREKLWSMALAKIKRGLTPILQPNSPKMEFYTMLFTWGAVLILSMIAFPVTLIQSLRSRDPTWLIHLTILHFIIITVIFFGYARYRYSIEPLCVLLAGSSIGFVVNRISLVTRGYYSTPPR